MPKLRNEASATLAINAGDNGTEEVKISMPLRSAGTIAMAANSILKIEEIRAQTRDTGTPDRGVRVYFGCEHGRLSRVAAPLRRAPLDQFWKYSYKTLQTA